MFDIVYIKSDLMKLFELHVAYLIVAYIKKNNVYSIN